VRRTVVICASLIALLVPAAALALQSGGDGTLVVQNGTAPKGVAVITLVIRGVAIGQISGYGKVVIDDPTGDNIPEVTNYVWHRSTGTEDTWAGSNFRFRAVGGTYRITVYGQDVDLVASGQGTVVLTGSPDAPTTDGRYSLNGQDFRSLPATPTKPLRIFVATSATG
jgi:hypothetical protein